MDDIVIHGRALGRAERVNSAHVTEDASAQVVNVIEINPVSLGEAVAVAPRPPDRHARVAETANVVVRDLIVPALTDPHADGAHVNVTPTLDDVIVHHHMTRALGFVGSDSPFADPHPARAEVMDV